MDVSLWVACCKEIVDMLNFAVRSLTSRTIKTAKFVVLRYSSVVLGLKSLWVWFRYWAIVVVVQLPGHCGSVFSYYSASMLSWQSKFQC